MAFRRRGPRVESAVVRPKGRGIRHEPTTRCPAAGISFLAVAASVGLATTAEAATVPSDPYGYSDARLCSGEEFWAYPDIFTQNWYHDPRVVNTTGSNWVVYWQEWHQVVLPIGPPASVETQFSVSCSS